MLTSLRSSGRAARLVVRLHCSMSLLMLIVSLAEEDLQSTWHVGEMNSRQRIPSPLLTQVLAYNSETERYVLQFSRF